MGDDLLNGQPMQDWEVAVVAYGRECELGGTGNSSPGLLAEYPREASPVPRPVTDVSLALLP